MPTWSGRVIPLTVTCNYCCAKPNDSRGTPPNFHEAVNVCVVLTLATASIRMPWHLGVLAFHYRPPTSISTPRQVVVVSSFNQPHNFTKARNFRVLQTLTPMRMPWRPRVVVFYDQQPENISMPHQVAVVSFHHLPPTSISMIHEIVTMAFHQQPPTSIRTPRNLVYVASFPLPPNFHEVVNFRVLLTLSPTNTKMS